MLTLFNLVFAKPFWPLNTYKDPGGGKKDIKEEP